MEVKAGDAALSLHTELWVADCKRSGAGIGALVEIVAAVTHAGLRAQAERTAVVTSSSMQSRKALASPPRPILNLNSLHVFV